MRIVVHAAANLLGWIAFFWSWAVVLGRPHETADLWWLIIGSALLFPLLTIGWIRHNVMIFRRRGPRRASRAVPLQYAVDFNGRHIEADWPHLASARIVTIETIGTVKRFLPAVPYTGSAVADRDDQIPGRAGIELETGGHAGRTRGATARAASLPVSHE